MHFVCHTKILQSNPFNYRSHHSQTKITFILGCLIVMLLFCYRYKEFTISKHLKLSLPQNKLLSYTHSVVSSIYIETLEECL